MFKSTCCLLALIGAFVLSASASASDYEMTCYSEQTEMCGEYGFSSRSDRDSFKEQCRGSGGEVLSGGCPAAPSCYQSQGGRSVRTYIYNVSSDAVRRNCESNYGSFRN